MTGALTEKPLTAAPKVGTHVLLVDISGPEMVYGIRFSGHSQELHWLKSGLLFLTQAGAKAKARRMLAADEMYEKGRALIEGAASTYRLRNGRQMGIEADDGEKCWIVHSDLIEALRAALATAGEP